MSETQRDVLINKVVAEYFETRRLSTSILKHNPDVREDILNKLYKSGGREKDEQLCESTAV